MVLSFSVERRPPPRRTGNPPPMVNDDLLNVMYEAFQGMATLTHHERPAEDRKQEYFCEFRRLPIPTFNDERGPQVADD